MDAKLKRRRKLCCNCQDVQQHGALPVSTVSLPLRAMFTIDATLVIVGLRISRVYSWCISNYGTDSAQREMHEWLILRRRFYSVAVQVVQRWGKTWAVTYELGTEKNHDIAYYRVSFCRL